MKIIVDKNTATKAVCEMLHISYSDVSVHAIAFDENNKVMPLCEIIFDFEGEEKGK